MSLPQPTPNTCPFCDLFVDSDHTVWECRRTLVQQRDDLRGERGSLERLLAADETHFEAMRQERDRLLAENAELVRQRDQAGQENEHLQAEVLRSEKRRKDSIEVYDVLLCEVRKQRRELAARVQELEVKLSAQTTAAEQSG